MTGFRRSLLAAFVLVSLGLAYFLRGLIYDVVVVPLAYLLWLGGTLYAAIPQGFLWVLITVVLALALVWNFALEVRPSQPMVRQREVKEGPVEALAVWIRKSRTGTYSKWQVANRLGRIARRLGENPGEQDGVAPPNRPVAEYLDAGMNHSFVDFPAQGNLLRRRPATPLDLDPTEAVKHLESAMERRHGRHP